MVEPVVEPEEVDSAVLVDFEPVAVAVAVVLLEPEVVEEVSAQEMLA